MERFDTIIQRGRWFDGTGAASAVRDIGIVDGRVAAISEAKLAVEGCARVIDAEGQWVTPGLIDIHTHYDAEVLVAPGLGESVRHGVTTVFVGSCSLSTVHAAPLDCADLFSRVEAVPRDSVLGALDGKMTWRTASEYIGHLESLPLGPNVAAFLGHSDLRTHVMGLGRAVEQGERPTEAELEQMETLLDDALEAGFVGLSTMTNPWDKLDGDRFRSRPLPSTFATWGEYRRLNHVLRDRDRILQSAPNLTSVLNSVLFFAQSAGLPWRKSLKTSLLTAADPKASPGLSTVVLALTKWLNRFVGTALRWQHLPVPFEVYADGMDLVVFEELAAGRAALHLASTPDRNALLQDPAYRARFRAEYDWRFSPRVWQRNFFDAEIVECPDASLVGKSVGDVAVARSLHPVDAFCDLVVEHGTSFRWRTTIANHRPKVLDAMANEPAIQMGFADSGAHLRNMAFYNFGVRLLRRVVEAEAAGTSFMTPERAVQRLTGELGEWYGIDAGRLCVGDAADIAIIDPRRLDASVDGYYEATVPEFGGISRMVNRGDAVRATLVGGDVVYRDGELCDGYGVRRSGRFLRANRKSSCTTNPGATVRPAA